MKNAIIETERTIIRELVPTDGAGMFELDSNPNVHRYIERKPVESIEQSKKTIIAIRKQYAKIGVGRWAVELKETGKFIGWTGFKANGEPINDLSDYVDLGYRFIEDYWGKGYATETGIACPNYAFTHLPYEKIYGFADVNNGASNHILKKIGFKFENKFLWDETPHYCYSTARDSWLDEFGPKTSPTI